MNVKTHIEDLEQRVAKLEDDLHAAYTIMDRILAGLKVVTAKVQELAGVGEAQYDIRETRERVLDSQQAEMFK